MPSTGTGQDQYLPQMRHDLTRDLSPPPNRVCPSPSPGVPNTHCSPYKYLSSPYNVCTTPTTTCGGVTQCTGGSTWVTSRRFFTDGSNSIASARSLSVTSCISEQLISINVERSRGGLVFKAHELMYHSTLGSRVIKQKRRLPASTASQLPRSGRCPSLPASRESI